MSKPRPPRSDRPLVRRREDQPLPHLRSRPPLTGRNEGLGNITIGRVRARRGHCGHRPDGIGDGWRTPRTDRPAGWGNDLHPAGVVFHARLIAAIVAAVGRADRRDRTRRDTVFDRAIAGRLMRWCLGGWALDRDHRRVPQPAAVRHRQRGGGRYELLWQPTAWQPPGGNALSFGVLVPGYLPAALSLGRLAPPSVMENAPEPHRGGPEPATEVPSDFDDEEKAVPTSHSGELPQ